jgi:hypothetical protein
MLSGPRNGKNPWHAILPKSQRIVYRHSPKDGNMNEAERLRFDTRFAVALERLAG